MLLGTLQVISESGISRQSLALVQQKSEARNQTNCNTNKRPE